MTSDSASASSTGSPARRMEAGGLGADVQLVGVQEVEHLPPDDDRLVGAVGQSAWVTVSGSSRMSSSISSRLTRSIVSLRTASWMPRVKPPAPPKFGCRM